MKSDNLQYNMLVRWFAGTNDSLNNRLMFKAFFFIISYILRALKTLYFYFCKFIKKLKNTLKQFLKRILQEIMKKKILGTSDAWSMSRLSQRPSVLY